MIKVDSIFSEKLFFLPFKNNPNQYSSNNKIKAKRTKTLKITFMKMDL